MCCGRWHSELMRKTLIEDAALLGALQVNFAHAYTFVGPTASPELRGIAWGVLGMLKF